MTKKMPILRLSANEEMREKQERKAALLLFKLQNIFPKTKIQNTL